jgi:pimeloyl-ACP methyl ester carboxylesterase
VARVPTDDHRLELDDGRTIGYSTWGDSQGTPVFIAHGTPGSRRALSSGLDDSAWLRQQRLRFIGVDRPGYGYSDPWHEASLLDCAEDFVRVADHLRLERFAALGVSGGGPYAIGLGALVPERVKGVAIVSGLGMLDRPGALEEMSEGNVEEIKMAMDSPDDLATALGEAPEAIRQDPEGSFAELSGGASPPSGLCASRSRPYPLALGEQGLGGSRSVQQVSPVNLLASVYACPGFVHRHLRRSLLPVCPRRTPPTAPYLATLRSLISSLAVGISRRTEGQFFHSHL